MDENSKNGANSNLATSDIKLWLPPTYTNNKIQTSSTNNNPPTPPAPKKKRMSWDFAGKTAYERIMLILTFFAALGAIAIPIAIAIGTTWFSYQQNLTSQQITLDQQQETTLKTYLDDISDLLLNHNLRMSKQGDEARQIARAKTLVALLRLNSIRKVVLIEFLSEANLITGTEHSLIHDGKEIIPPIIDLSEADLHDIHPTINLNLGGARLLAANLHGATLFSTHLDYANLEGADLNKADLTAATLRGARLSFAKLNNASLLETILTGANLEGADLTGVDLRGADLRGTDLTVESLSGANLEGADLRGAKINYEQLASVKSLKGATMPDGSIHP